MQYLIIFLSEGNLILTENNTLLIQELQCFSPENTIIISKNRELTIGDFRCFDIIRFCEYILRKSPVFAPPKTLSETQAEYLIQNIIKNTFKNNSALFNLTKSNGFAKELYEIFGKLLICGFSPDDLKTSINEIDINKEDFERLSCITETFKIYLEKLNEINFLDKRQMPFYAAKLLNDYPMYFKNISVKIQNIVINAEEEFNSAEKNLLQMFCEPQKLNFWQRHENAFASALSKQYLQTDEETSEQSKTKMIIFNDIRDEASFIADDIIKKTGNSGQKFSDFTVAAASTGYQKIFKEIFNAANIPCSYPKISAICLNFIIKLNNILSICDNLSKLEQQSSSADIDNIYDEINLNFQNLISSALENQFIKDKFLTVLEQNGEKSLIDCVRNNLDILNSKDCLKIKEELEILDNCAKLYNEQKITEIVLKIAKTFDFEDENLQKYLAKLINKIENYTSFSKETGNSAINFSDIISIINSEQYKNTEKNNNSVQFMSIKHAGEKPAKNLYLACLTEKSFPPQDKTTQFISYEANRLLSENLNSKNHEFKSFINNNSEEQLLYAEYLIKALTSAENTTMSTHNYEDKKQTQPSLFFQFLNKCFPQNAEISAYTSYTAAEAEKPDYLNNISEKKTVLKNDETLYLNASAINTFNNCPKKFYYSDLLAIKESSSYAAEYGTIVHSIMENFNKKYLNSYNKETLINLANILLNAANEPQKAISKGFDERDTERIKAADLLSLEEMKANFINAVDELEKAGFFAVKPTSVLSETYFNFTLPEIENVVFNGKIDAIYEYSGEYRITDYKTGGDVELKKDVQLPLYYLACKHDKKLNNFADKITKVSYQYIRAKNQKGGSRCDLIEASHLDEILPDITENIKENVIKKIRNTVVFEPKFSVRCKTCVYKCLCSSENGGNND